SGAPRMKHPRSGAVMEPRLPGSLNFGPLASDEDALGELAAALARDRQFARALANRVWFHVMWRGIVEPVDDFRESNPPSNPALLEALTDEFIAGGMRLRPLIRLILLSHTYQLDSSTNETNADDDSNFSHALIRLLPAEVLLDALSQSLASYRASPAAPAMT